MSRPLAIFVALSCASGVFTYLATAQSSGEPRPQIARTAAAKSTQTVQSALRGVSSCTATACHGARSESNPSWRSAYAVWVNQDPHAKAYSVLHERRSREIVQQLRGLKSADEAKPWKEQSCLACHTVSGADHLNTALVGDGVSCEACHGASGGWLQQHVTQRWATLSTSQKAAHGMRDLSDLTIRAQMCVGCHVGAPADETLPARDVNHDMIAAGHPRLTFEFTAYMQNMPPHWDEGADRQVARYIQSKTGAAKYDNFEARAWAVGQAITGKAALDLLAARAAAASADEENDQSTRAAPWPEFSESACYDCHHDLRDSQSRQEEAAERIVDGGLHRWGSWNYPLLELLAHGRLGIQAELDLMPVHSAMGAAFPEPGRVATAARSASEQATWFAEHLAAQNFREKLPEMVSGVVAAWREDISSAEHRHDWDRQAQHYLAAVALHNALIERNGGKTSAADEQFQKLLLQIRQGLRFPEQANSPADFDGATIREPIDQLQSQLRMSLGTK